MIKMPCLFQRDFSNPRRPVLLEAVTPGCEWVLDGEGTATRKWDGTACAVIGGVLHARYDAKKGKVPPPGAIPCGLPDEITGHWPHWIVAEGPDFKYIREAWSNVGSTSTPDGTYEAIGPKINGNHDGRGIHLLMKHGDLVFTIADRSYGALLNWLMSHPIEGIVFHHPDGRMCKIRRDDYGLPWPAVSSADIMKEMKE